MKKLLCFILVLTMLLGMGAFAKAEGELSFVVSSAEAKPGDEVQITVNIVNNPGIAAAEFTVVYDENVLEWTAVTQGEYTGIWDAEPGVKVTWFSNNGNWTSDGLFCTLTFKVKEGVTAEKTEVDLSFEEETVFDWDEVDVPYTVSKGTISLGGGEEPGELAFVVSSAEAKPGDEVQITVSIENNPGIAAAEFTVVYDESVLEWTAVTQGEYTGIWDAEPGVKVTWFSNSGNWDLNGLFCTLTFKVKEGVTVEKTEVDLSFEEETVFDWDEVDVPYTVTKGTITLDVPETLKDGYYLIGQKGWDVASIDPEQKFETNPENTNEYLLETGLAVGDGIKVVKVENGAITEWYPGGVDNQYVVDAAHAGRKTVYFKTTYDNAWSAFGGFMWIDGALTVGAEVYGSSVSLKGDIALNFFLILPEKVTKDENAYVTLNETKYPVSKATTRNVEGVGTTYQFTIALTAKQMNDKVTLKVFNGEDAVVPLYRHSNGEDVTETGYVYSVQDYIQKTLENPEADEKLKALVQAMSDYGSLAQVQFEYNLENLAEVKGDLNSVTAETVAAYAPVVTEGTATGVTFKGPSLVLKTQTALRLYFELAEGEIGDYTFKVGTKTKTPTETADGWMIEIPNISAKDLDKVYTVKVTSGDGTVLTLKVSALSYVYNTLNSETSDAKLVNLVKGVYLYNQAANAYFA